MNQNPITKFFATFNISTHTLVGAYATVTAYLAVDATARGLVLQFLANHPYWAIIGNFAAFAVAKYSGSHSTQGQAAQLIAAAQTEPAKVADAVAIANAASPEAAPVVSVSSPKAP